MTSELNKRKAVIKTNPNLHIELDEFQKDAFKKSFDFDINFIIGDAASGKTATAAYIALYHKMKFGYEKIYACRSIVNNKKLGALGGGIQEKLQPYVYPIIQNLEACRGKKDIEAMMGKGDIEILPAETIKGITTVNAITIYDEVQDNDYADFRSLLTRTGVDSKAIFCLSYQQIDRIIGENSCVYTIERLKNSGEVGWTELQSNHRNPALTNILKILDGK